MDKNFPELLEGSALKSQTLKPTGLSVYYSDADVQRMRNAGINTLTQTSSGRIISSPGGGTNLNRNKGQKSIKVARASIDMRKRLKEVEHEINREAQAAGVPDGHQATLTEENGKLIVTDATGTLNIEIDTTTFVRPLY